MQESLDVCILLDKSVSVTQFFFYWLVRLYEFGVERRQIPRIHRTRRHAPVTQNCRGLRERQALGIARHFRRLLLLYLDDWWLRLARHRIVGQGILCVLLRRLRLLDSFWRTTVMM